MFRRIHIFALGLFSVCGLEAQYISEVLEYTPAPGQFINSSPWGTPHSAQSIIGGVNGSMSLGAFGGTVVFRFEEAVENHPDNPFGVDFTIFGNPMTDWSEPGIVSVMEDVNGNGMADDRWYELAGSDHYFSSTQREYRLSYFNPGDTVAEDVPWEDEMGNAGFIRTNSVHSQPYYPFTDSFSTVPAETFTITGTLLEGAIDVDHLPFPISKQRAFGYADNQRRGQAPYTFPDNPYTEKLDNSGGDAFDISWAVDEEGNYVEFERIDFVKVQSGILHQGGFLGEISTEITGAVDVAPAPDTSGPTGLLVIKDLLPEMENLPHLMEVFLFHGGRLVEDALIQWNCSEDWARVDEQQQLITEGTGLLTISASVEGEPQLLASVSTLIIEKQITSRNSLSVSPALRLYPNPAGEQFRVYGAEGARVTIFDASGRMLKQIRDYREGMEISIGEFPPGVYLVKLGSGATGEWLRLSKQ